MSNKLEKLTMGLNKQLEAQKPKTVVKIQAPGPVMSALPNATGNGVERVTLSLHGTDTQRLNELGDYLRTLGHRESNRSLLVKVALRGLQFTPDLVSHLSAAQAEDGRRRKA